jgi:predicted membrane metal-binding protein
MKELNFKNLAMHFLFMPLFVAIKYNINILAIALSAVATVALINVFSVSAPMLLVLWGMVLYVILYESNLISGIPSVNKYYKNYVITDSTNIPLNLFSVIFEYFIYFSYVLILANLVGMPFGIQ